jgi:WD40 repeat protein
MATATGGRIALVVAIRADFYGRCAAYPELSRLLGANQVLVGPMTREELRRAIERPAQRAGLTVDPELVEALLADVDGQPGALPLLSTALLELWHRREGRHLRVAAYARTGGVQGAVARLAEDAYLELDPEQQEIARALFLRLADDGEDGTVVRRRIALDGLGAEREHVVAQLSERRLLTVSDGAVEVAHEALLREWPRVREWLHEDVEGRRLHRRLADAARAWDADGRDPGGLYRGARLAAANDWAAGHERELDETERAFLADSRGAAGRATRRLRALLAGLAALLAVAVVAGLVALEQRGNARAEATAAAAQRLGAQALADDDLDRSLLLARQGMALDDSLQTRGNLFAALLKSPAAIGVLRGEDALSGLALSPDEGTVAFTGADGTLSAFDTRTRVSQGSRPVTGLVVPDVGLADALRFSDDGRLLAISGIDPVLLDARTREELARLPIADGEIVTRLAFSRDSRSIFAGLWTGRRGDTRVRRYDVRSGRRLGREWYLRGLTPLVLMTTRDGRLVTSSAGRTVVRDGRSLRPLRQFPAGSEHAALGPDDRTLLLGGRDGSVRFLDLVTGEVRTAAGRHDGRVVRAVFGADGRTAVTAGQDRHVIVWDVRRAVPAETLTGHAGLISGLALSADGRTLYTSGLDGKAIIWDLGGDRRLGRPVDVGRSGPVAEIFGPPFVSAAMRPDGRVLAVGRPDGTVRTIDAETLERLKTFPAAPGGRPVMSMAYMPGGRLLVVGGEGFLVLVDPRSGAVVQRLGGHPGVALVPSFSADGRLMATADLARGIKLWTLRGGRPAGTPRSYYPPDMIDASLSPDGRSLALAKISGIDIVDVDTLRVTRTLRGSESLTYLARFTPDGRYVVGGSAKGWARLWSARTWEPVTGELGGHTREVYWASVTRDGRMLATGSTDGTVRVFDVRTGQLVGAPLTGVPDRAVAPLFSPDGGRLFTITNAGSASRWDLRPSAWARHACEVAGRTLTRAEWDAVLPGRDYDPACAGS